MAKSATRPTASDAVKKKAEKSYADRQREMYCSDKTEAWPARYRRAVYSWR